MCEKCIEFYKKIEHFRTLSTWVLERTQDGRILIARYDDDKKALHPE